MDAITTPTIFKFHTHEVRTVIKDGEPWFVAVDVCAALEYKNSRDAVATHLDADEKGVADGDTLGGKQSLSIISESGLYALVLRSRNPEARAFAKWVTSEVLPAIRKTGRYETKAAAAREASLRNNLVALCSHIEFLRSWWKEYGPAIESLNSKVASSVHDHFIDGVCVARNVVRTMGLESQQTYATGYPWRGDEFARRTYYTTTQKVLA